VTLVVSESAPQGIIEANLELLIDDENVPRITRRVRGVVR